MNFIYSVTVGLDRDIEQDWLAWMNESFFKRIMMLDIFSKYKIYKVLTHEDETSVSYNIQYHCDAIEKIVYFLNHEGKVLMEEHRSRFKDKHVVFNTLLQEI